MISVGDWASRIGRAASRRIQGLCLAKGDCSRASGCETTCKLRGVHALELALEDPGKFRVPWCLLAVGHAEGVGLRYGKHKVDRSIRGCGNRTYAVSRLLAKDLCSCDHIGRVERLGKIHHVIRGVLLVTCTCSSKEGTKGVDSNGVALRGTAGRILTMSKD